MKFLLLAYGDEQKSAALSESEMRALGEKCIAYDEELRATGRLVASGTTTTPFASRRCTPRRGSAKSWAGASSYARWRIAS